MATEKTPAHKRIRRAEQGREEWKIKAQLRREENEKLNRELKSKEVLISELMEENQASKDQLVLFQKKVKEQDKLIEKLKKNSK
jgi:phage shock protein A